MKETIPYWYSNRPSFAYKKPHSQQNVWGAPTDPHPLNPPLCYSVYMVKVGSSISILILCFLYNNLLKAYLNIYEYHK